MRKPVLIVLAALLTDPASAAERRYSVTEFDRVQVDGPFQVTLRTGMPGSAVATGTNAEIDRVSIDVQGRTLRVRPNSSAWGGYPGERVGTPRIALTTHDVRALLVRGPASLDADRVKGMRADVTLSGSGRIAVGRVEADQLTLGLTGSGQMIVAGETKGLRATVEGSGDLQASDLEAADADINAGTSGTVDLLVTRAATVSSTGIGTVTIAGGAACTIRQTGAGQVLCDD